MRIAARDVKPGMWLDLEGDRYADPASQNTDFQFAYALVDSVDFETPDCVAIWFEGFDCVGFPPDHKIKVRDDL